MERINAYTTRNAFGDAVVDIEGMAVDLITVAKMGKMPLEVFLNNIRLTWDKVEVTITPPPSN